MAIIGKIRERSTLVLFIIGGAIVAFILTDFFSSRTSGGPQVQFIAEVGNENVSAVEFNDRVTTAYENFKNNNQSTQPLDERTKASIREQVWNDMLIDIIIGNEMEALGIDVTSRELGELVYGDNPDPQIVRAFSNPETGQFDKNQVLQFIQGLDNNTPEVRDQWFAYEKNLKRQRRISKYNNLVKKGLYMPTAFAEDLANETNNQATIEYVLKRYNEINDTSITVSEADLKAYYEANKSKYEQPASHKIEYAFFPITASEKDFEVARNWAEEVLEKFKTADNDSIFVNAYSDKAFDPTFYKLEDFPLGIDTSLFSAEEGTIVGPFIIEKEYKIQKVTQVRMIPDSVNARHILIDFNNQTPDAALAKADSLQKLLADGADFGALASENSDDLGSAQKAGDLGWFVQGTMVPTFNDAAFSAEVGVVKRVISQYGIHLLEVMEQSDKSRHVQIAAIDKLVVPGGETVAKVFNDANSFSINAKGKSKEEFDALINEKNISRRVAILGEQENEIRGMEGTKDVVRWVKSASENDVSIAKDIDGAFVVVYVTEVNEEGVAPLDKVRAVVEVDAKREAKAEQFMSEMGGAADLEALAGKLGTEVGTAEGVSLNNPLISGAGYEPAVIGAAFSGLPVGQMSAPLKGRAGVFVVKLVTQENSGTANAISARGTVERGYISKIDNQLMFNAIKEASDVTDNRSSFY